MRDPDAPFVRLIASRAPSTFILPGAAWRAIQTAAVASSSRPLGFADLPAGPEEAAVLSVWLSAILDGDPGTEADQEALVRADGDFFGGEAWPGRALAEFLRESDGFRVEGMRARSVPVPQPSAN